MKRSKTINRALVHLTGWIICYFLLFFSYLNIAPVSRASVGSLFGTLMAVSIFYWNILLVNLFLVRGRRLMYFIAAALHLLIIIAIRFAVDEIQSPEKLGIIFPHYPVRNFAFLIFASLILFLIGTLYRLSQVRMENERRLRETLAEQQQAQIAYLKAQINPHFLFNTLNNIYSLAVEKSEQAPAALLQLSDLLRYSVYTSGEKRVSVDEEAAQIETYISLFRMRSDKPLDITFSYNRQPGSVMIEPMILIPLVENSLKHTDFETSPGAFIRITLDLTENGLLFSSSNTKCSAASAGTTAGGLGLPNIRKRLNLIYPETHRFETDDSGETFNVFLSIQWNKRSSA